VLLLQIATHCKWNNITISINNAFLHTLRSSLQANARQSRWSISTL